MYRFQTFILVSLFSIICLSIAGCTAHSKKERYVVVLSMDGFRSDYPSHAHTPTLDSLACVWVKAASYQLSECDFPEPLQYGDRLASGSSWIGE